MRKIHATLGGEMISCSVIVYPFTVSLYKDWLDTWLYVTVSDVYDMNDELNK
jgi:hypothetical protein